MRFKMLFAAMFISVCVFVSVIPAESSSNLRIDSCNELLGVYKYGDNDFVMVMSSDGYYYTAVSESERFNCYNTGISVDTNDYCYADGYIYFFENTIESDGVKSVSILIYDCTYNTKEKRVINCGVDIIYNTIAADRYGNIYIINGRTVDIYINYKLADTIRIDTIPVKVVPSFEANCVYCVTTESVAAISPDTYVTYPVRTDYVYPTEEGFSDSQGKLYKASNDEFEEVYSGFEGIHGSAAAGEILLGVRSGRLTSYYNETEHTICELDASAYICASGSRFIAAVMSDGGVNAIFIDIDDIINSDTENDRSLSSSSENDASSFTLENLFTKDNVLYGIAPGTTVAEIKKRINSKNCTISFYDKNGRTKSSGTVGTGYTLTITGDNTTEYTIMIFGDISGEGNINKNDRSALTNFLLDASIPDGIFADASDINHDGKVDLKDLSALNMYINGDYNIKQDIYK